MAIRQSLMNLDRYFDSLDNVVVLNHMSVVDPVKDLIYTATDEVIDMIPSCVCGHLKNGYKLGKICPMCNSKVVRTFDSIDPILWATTFKDDLPFINPMFWLMLSKFISTKVDALGWLSNTNSRQRKIPEILHSISNLIGGRGYMNVVNNIGKILTYLKSHSTNTKFIRKLKLIKLTKLFKQNSSNIFISKLPLINRRLFVSESSKDGSYNSILLSDVIDIALLTVVAANEPEPTDKYLENVMSKLVNNSGNLYAKYVHTMVSQKGGLARQNIYGTRAYFNFRAVISQLPSKYNYDELVVPWIVGVSAFRPHIINILMNRHDYTLKACDKLLDRAAMEYVPLIDDILKLLIAESPEKGIPLLFNRNPTQGQSSMVKMYIVEFLTDLNVTVIYLSSLLAALFNADYDGDEMNATLLLSNELSKMANVFEAHHNIVDVGIYKIGGKLNIPTTAVMNISNYLDKKEVESQFCEIFDELIDLDLTA